MVTREGIAGVVGGELVDYLTPADSPEISTEEFENMMGLLLRKYKTQVTHIEEKIFKVLNALNNYHLANIDKTTENTDKFNQPNLRKMLIAIDRRTNSNEAESFYRYVTSNKIDSFEGLKAHVTSLNFSKLRSYKFNESLILIFEKCI